MVKIKYESRLLTDMDFLNSDFCDKKTLLYLKYIKASSEDHPKQHNVMLDEDYESAKGNLTEEDLLASFKRIPIPPFLISEKDPISKYVRFAIQLTSEKPFRSIILTSPEKHKEFINNPHMSGITRVSIKSGKDAQELIGKYFRKFTLEKELKKSPN